MLSAATWGFACSQDVVSEQDSGGSRPLGLWHGCPGLQEPQPVAASLTTVTHGFTSRGSSMSERGSGGVWTCRGFLGSKFFTSPGTGPSRVPSLEGRRKRA